MKFQNRIVIAFYSIILSCSVYAEFPSFDPNFPPPAGVNRFELSQDYPVQYEDENYPWLNVNPFENPEKYMDVVLAYSLEGNLEVNFKGQDNQVRKWYHAPWLHDDSRLTTDGRPGNGREYINGLTRERGTPLFEIHKNQDVRLENWAVGMYNAPGGYTLGRVWKTETGVPNPRNSTFPEGTVSFKLLFTDGEVQKVPFLEGTLEWTANIYKCNPRGVDCRERINRKVRLIQIDIAIKDQRAKKTGWFFGTFMYDASASGRNVWEKMVPVGLSWGDDQIVFSRMNDDGAFVNSDLKETYLNPSLIEDPDKEYTDQAYVRYHGLGGRLNGPVDNPISSCISCHGQAGVSDSGNILPMADFSQQRVSFSLREFIRYFSNVRPGAYGRNFDGRNYISTDYSLQLSAGIRNYYQSVAVQASGESSLLSPMGVKELNTPPRVLPSVTRGE